MEVPVWQGGSCKRVGAPSEYDGLPGDYRAVLGYPDEFHLEDPKAGDDAEMLKTGVPVERQRSSGSYYRTFIGFESGRQ